MFPGPGPVYPLLVGDYDRRGAFLYRTATDRPHSGWWLSKLMWWIDPRESHEVLIRAAPLDRSSPILLANGDRTGEDVVTIDEEGGPNIYSSENLLLTARDVPNIMNGWRNYPGVTAFRSGGCYSFQIDGFTFSYTIVFHAVP